MGKEFDVAMGSKIKALRNSAGFTLEQAAGRLGYKNYQVLLSIENGERTLKASELSVISQLFHRDIGFFLSEQKAEGEELLVRWRDCSNLEDRKEKETEFLAYCESYFDLEKRLNLESRHSLDPLNFDEADIKNYEKINELAENRARQFELGLRPACGLRKILEERANVKVLFLDLSGHGSAAAAMGRFGAAILINRKDPLGRRNYDIAHEMFHLVTWDKFRGEEYSVGGDKYRDLETTANAFASALLMPELEIRREFGQKLKNSRISLVDLVGMSQEFQVSLDALLWRLVNLKLLDRALVGKFFTEERHRLDLVRDSTNACGCNEDEAFISGKYIYLAVKAFKEGLVSKSKLAAYLKMNIGDVAQVLAKYGYTLEDDANEELAVAGR
ncbi:MAG: ImmA/IrrE family metallo-endopeptidase [Candidatus Omnitrophica bacterium]|nr:ImmA/IrrE family metallo-endopeptidase [Candidatus Omnitrophota bacterium]